MVLSNVLITLFAVSYVGAITLGIVMVAHQPAFQPEHHTFDLRLTDGSHTILYDAIPSIVWETPENIEEQEAYHPVHTERRVTTKLGYRVELMGR